MPERASSASIAGAKAYEALHVPALFGEWVDPVLNAAKVEPGQTVLDVACGTGVLARGAGQRVGPSGSVIGIDPDAGMLAVAEELDSSVDWREGVAESLPLPDEAVDTVVSQFGMMFFRDHARAAQEMFRVLRRNGRIVVAVWDVLEKQPAYSIEVGLLDELVGTQAGDALRAPFVLGDPERVRMELDGAGFEDVVIDTRIGTGRFPSVRSLVEADLRGWLPLMGVHLTEETMRVVLDASEREMSHLVTDDGQAVFDSPAHLISARKP